MELLFIADRAEEECFCWAFVCAFLGELEMGGVAASVDEDEVEGAVAVVEELFVML